MCALRSLLRKCNDSGNPEVFDVLKIFLEENKMADEATASCGTLFGCFWPFMQYFCGELFCFYKT